MTSPNVVHGFPSGLSVRADGRTNEHLANDTQDSRSEYPSWMAHALTKVRRRRQLIDGCQI